MLERANTPNELQIYIETHKLKPNVRWTEYTGQELLTFPRLTLQELRDITLGAHLYVFILFIIMYIYNNILSTGVYQLKMAKSYVHEKVQRDEDFKFKMTASEPGLLHAKVYSRFSRASKHSTWI